MEIITVIKIKDNGEMITHAFSSLEKAKEAFPIINAYPQEHPQIKLPWGMNIHNFNTHINVKECFVY